MEVWSRWKIRSLASQDGCRNGRLWHLPRVVFLILISVSSFWVAEGLKSGFTRFARYFKGFYGVLAWKSPTKSPKLSNKPWNRLKPLRSHRNVLKSLWNPWVHCNPLKTHKTPLNALKPVYRTPNLRKQSNSREPPLKHPAPLWSALKLPEIHCNAFKRLETPLKPFWNPIRSS